MNDIALFGENNNILEGIRKLSETIRREETPSIEVRHREGKSGSTYKYVSGDYAMKWLDEHYPGWSFEILPDSFREYAGFVQVAGKITVYMEVQNKVLTRNITCFGQKEIILKGGVTPTTVMYIKAAETDALKRCCVKLGGFRDVYFEEEGVEKAPEKDLGWLLKHIDKLILRAKDMNSKPSNVFKTLMSFYYGEIVKEDLSFIEEEIQGEQNG